MNVHFIAWMSIALSFMLLGGGAYLVDTLTPHESGLLDIWCRHPYHLQFAHSFFFYGGIYAFCNFVYHLFGLRHVRQALVLAKRRAEKGIDLTPLAGASRAHQGTEADRLLRLGLASDTFERALTPRVWEIGSGARALAAAAALMILTALFATVMELASAARGVALTGVGYEPETVGWIAAAALSELATGIFLALSCFFGFFILREGARDAVRELDRVIAPAQGSRWRRAHS